MNLMLKCSQLRGRAGGGDGAHRYEVPIGVQSVQNTNQPAGLGDLEPVRVGEQALARPASLPQTDH